MKQKLLTAIIIFFFAFNSAVYSSPPTFKTGLKEDFYRASSRDTAYSLSKRIACIDSLIALIPAANRAPHLFEKAQLLEESERYDDAAKAYGQVLSRLPEDSVRLRLLSLFGIAKVRFFNNRYRESIIKASEILSAGKPDSLAWLDVESYCIIGAVAQALYQPALAERASRFAEKRLATLNASDASQFRKQAARALLMTNVAANLASKNPERAIAIIKEVKSMTNSPRLLAIINNNLGLIYAKIGERKIASECFLNVLKSKSTSRLRTAAAINYINGLLVEGKTLQADSAMRECDSLLSTVRGGEWEVQVWVLRSNVCEQKKDYRNALYALSYAYIISDSLKSLARDIMPDDLEAVLKVNDLNDDKPTDKFALWIAIGCLALLIIGLTVALWHNRKRRMAIGSERDACLVRLEKVQQSASALEEELTLKNEELSVNLMRLNQLSSAIDTIAADSEKLRHNPHSLAEAVRKTVKDTRHSKRLWEEHYNTDEGINQKFFDRLHKLQPGLTNAEVRMCGYALMNMSPKEIALVTNRSIKTVNCIRHNLRKKLGMSADENTETFMRHISSLSDAEFAEYLESIKTTKSR